MKNFHNQNVTTLIIDKLTSWFVFLQEIEHQLNQQKALSHDCTAELSYIINHLEQVNSLFEQSDLEDNQLLISYYKLCVRKLKKIHDKLFAQSKNILLEIMAANVQQHYKLEGLVNSDFNYN